MAKISQMSVIANMRLKIYVKIIQNLYDIDAFMGQKDIKTSDEKEKNVLFSLDLP